MNYDMRMGSRSLPVPRKNLRLRVKVPAVDSCWRWTREASRLGVAPPLPPVPEQQQPQAKTGREVSERTKKEPIATRTNQPRGQVIWVSGRRDEDEMEQVFPTWTACLEWNGTIGWIDDTFIICLCRFAFATARNQNVLFLTSQQVHPNVLGFWHVRDQKTSNEANNHCHT